MNGICGICFENTEELFRFNNSLITSCAKCLQRMNVSNQKDLIAHNSDISDNSEQECPICGKYFARRYSFMNHVRNHSAERKHVCRFCQKAFTQAANLRNHERIHTNERPYTCTVCQKAFTQITNLNNHIRLHTGERPFQCPVEGCDKAFAQVTNLNNHAKTHQRDKFVKCYICHKSFSHYSELSDHYRSHRSSNRNIYKEMKNKESHNSYINQAITSDVRFDNQTVFSDTVKLEAIVKNEYIDTETKKVDLTDNYSFNQHKIDKNILSDLKLDFQNIYKSEQNQMSGAKHTTHNTYEQKSIKSNNEVMKKDESNFHISCYFENCRKKFENNSDLNLHLNDIHGLSIFNRFDEKGMVKQYM